MRLSASFEPMVRRLALLLLLVAYDDDVYLLDNPHIQAGLSWESFRWAFASEHSANWHPLTWLSHLADISMFGMDPAGAHGVNLVLHLLNTLILFVALRRMTGGPWLSLLTAALFALHPLHVESVAWAAERKDLLSTLFCLLAMWAYAAYVERPRLWPYLLVWLSMAASLMSKPMFVTLPFLLLLLDYWPLRRFASPAALALEGGGRSRFGPWRLAFEKTPLLALSVVSCIVTLWAQDKGGALNTFSGSSMGSRLANAAVAYVAYLGKTLFPEGLQVFYPFDEAIAVWKWAGATTLLAAITTLALWRARRNPSLVTGWLWYMGALVPVVGLVKVGAQSMADRYAYVPQIGVFLAAVWAGAGIVAHRPRLRAPVIAGCVALCLALAWGTWRQTQHWRDSATLFSHALSVDPDSYVASNNLGIIYVKQGKDEAAERCFREAIRARSDFAEAHNDLGILLGRKGSEIESIGHLRRATRLKANYGQAQFNLGMAYMKRGQLIDAERHLAKAVLYMPGDQAAPAALAQVQEIMRTTPPVQVPASPGAGVAMPGSP